MTKELAARLELTLFAPLATSDDIERLCSEARVSGSRAVALPGGCVEQAYSSLGDSHVIISCLVGFPFGTSDPDVKRFETEAAVDSGAHEIELMPSLGRLKSGRHATVSREIRDVVEAADERPVKVVVECSLWTEAELAEIVRIILDSGARYATASSGFLSPPSTPRQVRALGDLAGARLGVKAFAPDDLASAEALLAAGADLLARRFA